MSDLYELSATECESLLKAGVVGRIAVLTPDGPHIFPVNYSVVDDAIVVRTSQHSVLATHGDDAVFAFEVDQFDYANQRGWSVLARGQSHVVHEQHEVERIAAVWAPRPWASGLRPIFLQLVWSELSGRRLGSGWNPLGEMPVRRVPSYGPTGPLPTT